MAYGVAFGAWQTSTASLTLKLFPPARFAQFDSARSPVSSFGMKAVWPGLGWFLDRPRHDYRKRLPRQCIPRGVRFPVGGDGYRRFRQLGGFSHYVPPE